LKNVQKDKDSCEHAIAVAAQFLNLAAGGIAFVVGLVFSTEPRMNPWLVVATCVIFALSIVLGLMVRMGLTSNIAKHGDYNIYAGPIRWVAVCQILLFLLGVAVLGGVTFRQAFAAKKPPVEDQTLWETLGHGMTEGISGLAWIEHDSEKAVLLAVHDSKERGQKRLSLITHRAGAKTESRTLPWPGQDPPQDLEAVCRLPGEERAFLALTGGGALFRLALEQGNTALRVVPADKKLDGGKEYEGLDVQRIAGKLIGCWAERGDGDGDGVLHFAIFDPVTLTFPGPQVVAKVRAPWPQAHVRHISDLRLLPDGTVLATSASDPGDDGPFAGTVYIAGSIVVENDQPRFMANNQPSRLVVTNRHKIEALEFLPNAHGGMVLGSDDENCGGALHFAWELGR
jgi:hypothetical protein